MILLALLAQSVTTLSLDLSKPGVSVSPNLYGLMTEEINYSYEGGLYGELLRNRTFKDNRQQPVHWTAVGEGASVTLEPKGGVSTALPVNLKVIGGVANGGIPDDPNRLPSRRKHPRRTLQNLACADSPPGPRLIVPARRPPSLGERL